MDIAAMSTMMSGAKVQQQAGYLMAKKTMDMQETSAANLLDMMQTSAPMAPGQRMDIRA